jgi:uncharacterized protein (DUF885 family)
VKRRRLLEIVLVIVGLLNLAVIAAFTTPVATEKNPAERLGTLIIADEESAKLSPNRWPDLSLKALHERERLDRTTLDELHAIARKDLVVQDRTIYDLFEWRLNRRLEQFRLRLYLTPFWDDDRFVGFAGVLGTAAALSPASRQKVESFPAYMNQAIVLLREDIRVRMLPSRDLVRSVSGECTAQSGGNPGDTAWNEAQAAKKDFCGTSNTVKQVVKK